MGGHRLARDAEEYRAVALLGRALARANIVVVSGGGPGAMEAAHLGAWHAGRRDEDLDTAIAILGHAPLHTPVEPWLDTALEVRRRFDGVRAGISIGVPTWHYGHEPSNVFPTAIAKYFANSEREDGLLALATHGVVFAPGSAGTIQEIFQDAAQNHYRVTGFASPMIFLGTRYWQHTKPVYPLLQQLAAGEAYPLLCITDSIDEPSTAQAFSRGDRSLATLVESCPAAGDRPTNRAGAGHEAGPRSRRSRRSDGHAFELGRSDRRSQSEAAVESGV